MNTTAAPSTPFAVSTRFSELAEQLAITLQNDDLLHDFIRFAFAIADEQDYLKREAVALAVAQHSFTRTCEFDSWVRRVLRNGKAI